MKILTRLKKLHALGAMGAILLGAGTAAAVNPDQFTLANPGNTQYSGLATLSGAGSVSFVGTINDAGATLDVTNVNLAPSRGYRSRLRVNCALSGWQDTNETGPFYDAIFGDKVLLCPFFWAGDPAVAAWGLVRIL